MAKNLEDKARHYYDKALLSYKSQRSFGDDAYEVYVQRLLDVIYKDKAPAEETQLRNSVFFGLLDDWVKNKKQFDFTVFKNEMQKRYAKRKRRARYNFVFGIHIKFSSGAQFPFKKQFTIKGVQFKIISRDAAGKYTQGILLGELSDLYRKKRYEKQWVDATLKNNYIYFRASVESIDEIVAANRITSAFGLLTACATVAQERHSRKYFTSGSIKGRRPIQNPYMLHWLEAQNPFEATLIVLGSDIEVQEASLEFAGNASKMKSFKKYLSIINKNSLTPIENRIKDVLFEFDRSLGATDPNLRMLGMWKCLEIASRMSDGTTRKYTDIIGVIRKYHDSDVIDEKAKLVLEARNAYVHQGLSLNYDKRDDYLRWLQDFVSAYLSLLMWMHLKGIGSKASDQVDRLFDFYLQSDEDLKLAARLVNARTKDKKRYAAAVKSKTPGAK